MTEASVLEIGRQAITLTLMLCLPILTAGLIVGVAVSVFQAVTQVQEMTLSFVPKLIAVAIALAVFGSWMLSKMVAFTVQTFQHVPGITH